MSLPGVRSFPAGAASISGVHSSLDVCAKDRRQKGKEKACNSPLPRTHDDWAVIYVAALPDTAGDGGVRWLYSSCGRSNGVKNERRVEAGSQQATMGTYAQSRVHTH